MKMKLDCKYNDPNDPNRIYFRSDHYNFAEKGVPIIFYFNGTPCRLSPSNRYT